MFRGLSQKCTEDRGQSRLVRLLKYGRVIIDVADMIRWKVSISKDAGRWRKYGCIHGLLMDHRLAFLEFEPEGDWDKVGRLNRINGSSSWSIPMGLDRSAFKSGLQRWEIRIQS